MLIVVKAQSRPRAEMELWFKRAMALDSCNRRACLNKIDYLRPAWGGSVKELLEFSHELAAGGNHAGGLAILVENIHWQIARLSPDAKDDQPDKQWFAQPGVWEELKKTYDGYLKLVPQSRSHRTSYMLGAAWSGHWDVAEEQLKLLDPNGTAKLGKEDAMVVEVIRQIREHATTRE
jgi:hypothetical protein